MEKRQSCTVETSRLGSETAQTVKKQSFSGMYLRPEPGKLRQEDCLNFKVIERPSLRNEKNII